MKKNQKTKQKHWLKMIVTLEEIENDWAVGTCETNACPVISLFQLVISRSACWKGSKLSQLEPFAHDEWARIPAAAAEVSLIVTDARQLIAGKVVRQNVE